MKIDTIIAIIGAASWAPQIINWISSSCSKAIVTIIPDKTANLGFTDHGPIFDLRLSINTDKKNALIDSIKVRISHQDGAEHYFECVGTVEYFSEAKNSKGESQVFQRESMPIPIKLSTLFLVERFFKFREASFIKERQIELAT